MKVNKNKNKILAICMILLIIVVLAIIIVVNKLGKAKEENVLVSDDGTTENQNVEEFVNNLENGGKINTSSKLNENREFEGLKIENIQLTYQNSQTQLLANVKNDTSTESELMMVEITLYDKDGNKIVSLDGIISPLKPGESTQLNIGSSLDYANAYDLEIVKK